MNQLFDMARQKFAMGQYSWENMTPKLVLLNTRYSVDLSVNNFKKGINGDQIVGISDTIMTYEPKDGWCLLDDVTFLQLPNGEIVSQMVLVEAPDDDRSTWELVAYYDQGYGLPWPITGGGAFIQWGDKIGAAFRI